MIRHGDTLNCLREGLGVHPDIVGTRLILRDDLTIDVSGWFEPVHSSHRRPMDRPAPRDTGRTSMSGNTLPVK